ncbi:hypothetical protein ACFL27_05045, partial [candidate division CSSED10-310 bacterium]
ATPIPSKAIEINPIIVNFVRQDFKSFSGDPYDLPGVVTSIMDGRSYVAQAQQLFDHIQLSAVDTTAAVAAGALSLVENSLYTVEAFEDYHNHLSERGLLSITRNWTMETQMMALRTADLIRTAWERCGHTGIDRHLVIVAPKVYSGSRWGTLLASRCPFSAADLKKLREITEKLDFMILYEPNGAHNPSTFEALLGSERRTFLQTYPYDVQATTDDKPYFFFFLKPFQFLTQQGDQQHLTWASRKTPRILLQAFSLVTVLVLVLALFIPMLVGRLRLTATKGAGRGLLYFAAIGLGFIMVEISLIQRFTLLLGQPLYSFAGILGCMLIFSGLGSFGSHYIETAHLQRRARLVISVVVLGILVHALFMPALLSVAMGASFWWRLMIVVVTIAPLGFVMGMPLPLGMRLLELVSPKALAWAWGVNGSLSVMGTVLAMVVSVFFGITSTLVVAALVYMIALFSFTQNP